MAFFDWLINRCYVATSLTVYANHEPSNPGRTTSARVPVPTDAQVEAGCKKIVDAIKTADPDRFQFHAEAAAGGVFSDETATNTRVVDGACIFHNSPDFDGFGGCALHNPLSDFNDDILLIGVSYWVKLVEHALPAQSASSLATG